MSDLATLGHRRALRFWGWGYANEHLSADEEKHIRELIAAFSGAAIEDIAPPSIDDFDLPAPRVSPPSSLAENFSDSPYDRLTHAYGKSFADCIRMFLREVPTPPDWVAYPKSEGDVVDILDWATGANVAVVPFGGGSSVCGGVEPAVGDDYAGAISLDLQYLNRVIEVDEVSRAARIQGGAFGPEIEDALRPRGLTLRHFPQSFQFSTLGGWIATRSGGHYATVHTHIDDFVESTRMVTPAGIMESRRLPGSGAGPSHDRMVIGSEGTLGVITEAWMRLQHRPTFRASVSVMFDSMPQAVETVRVLSQSGLNPTNCRLLDPAEVMLNRVGDGQSPTLVIGFESADHPVDAWMARTLELCADHGGRYDADALNREKDAASGKAASGAADAWRNAFLRMPYYRNLMVGLGLIADTFESAITWDRFDAFYDGVRERVAAAAREVTGREPMLSCRFTHVYPDGPAPYFTLSAVGSTDGDLRRVLGQWREIKQAANEAVTALGGTVTHHHAVGRDHRSGYEAQSDPLFREALAAAKKQLDPGAMLNPGVLIDAPDRPVGITGVMGTR